MGHVRGNQGVITPCWPVEGDEAEIPDKLVSSQGGESMALRVKNDTEIITDSKRHASVSPGIDKQSWPL